MTLEQDWTDVWPSAGTFRQSVIPLPIHQGYVKNKAENEGVPPGKYGNVELMKIPNFFHLTPAHIKKHCEAIKSKFCNNI
jgi:small subunit ribosomal protein S35